MKKKFRLGYSANILKPSNKLSYVLSVIQQLLIMAMYASTASTVFFGFWFFVCVCVFLEEISGYETLESAIKQ